MAFTLKKKKKKQPEFGKPQIIALAALLVIGGGGLALGLIFGSDESDSDPSNPTTGAASSEATASQIETLPPDEVENPGPVESTAPEVLTVENNTDLATLLSTNEDYVLSTEFAEQYAGRTIEFNANIAYMNPHGDYDTRYDFLVYAGDYSETEGNPGPAFQFRDKNYNDLGVTDPNRSSVGMGDNVRVTATVGEFIEQQGLFLLDPVSTSFR